ncbi:MAG: hypothetical protein ACJAVV_002298 [Alphaproteobacteria bacterium]|jgi:hypothetical protein
MAIAMLIIYGYLTAMGATGQGVFGRVTQAREAMARVVKEPNDLVMFYGSSMTRAGFSPRKFDRDLAVKGKQVTSFNFGFGGVNPYFQDFLSRRITQEMQQNDRRFKLVMIEFNPFQATNARWNRAKPQVDSLLTLVASDKELLEIAQQDITRGVRLFNIKYLRAGISAEMITTYFAYDMFPPESTIIHRDSEEVRAEQRRLGQEVSKRFDQDYPNYVNTQWSYEWQGGGTIPQERPPETLALFEEYYNASFTDAMMKNDRLSRIASADIEELHFEPLLIEHFINIVKQFQRVSDEVKVIILPKNSKWITTTPQANERLAQAIAQIESATGITIDNHQDIPEITTDMYLDSTHLARYRGDVAYTDYLVKEYGGLFD